MECKKLQERLSAYLDNEVSGQERRLLEEHLRSCAECRTELEALQAAGDVVKTLPEVTPSPDFRARFWQKVRESAPVQTLWERIALRWIPVPVVLAALVVVFSGFSAFSPLLYGTSETTAKQESVQLAARSFAAGANNKVFAPLNFVDFCDRCQTMLCPMCQEGACTNHERCGGMNK